jgi:hypothetical protein
MFPVHLLIVHLIVRAPDGQALQCGCGRISPQIRNREPAIVGKSQNQSFIGAESEGLHIDGGDGGLGRPHELAVLVDHQIVREGTQDEGETRRVVGVLGGLLKD